VSVYLIIEIQVADQETYGEYLRKVPPTVEKHGGRYLVRGGRVVPVAGDWRPERIVVVEFPSFEHLERWSESPEYQALAPLRMRATAGRAIAVEGVAGQGKIQ